MKANKNKVTAVLVHNSEDLTGIKRRFPSNVLLIAHEPYLTILCPEFKMKPFCENSIPENVYKQVNYLAGHWYRNKSGLDISTTNNISWAQVLTGSLLFTIPNIYREYYALKKWLLKVDKIFASVNENKLFKTVASAFPEIQFYEPGHWNKSLLSSCADRNFETSAYSNKAELAKFIQRPIRGLLKGKTVALSDWSYSDKIVIRKDTLATNFSCNIFKNAYLTEGITTKVNKKVPARPPIKVAPSLLKSVLLQKKILWDNALLKVLCQHINEKYTCNRKFFVRHYAAFCQMYDYYKPKRIIVPSETYEPHTIAILEARRRGIKVSLLPDGVYTTITGPNKKPSLLHYKDKSNRKSLFESIVLQGQTILSILRKNKFCPKSIQFVRPTMINLHKHSVVAKKKYDVLLCTLIPNNLNPNGYNGSRINSLKVMLESAKELQFQMIAIKAKHKSEIEWIQILIKKMEMEKICTILAGYFYEHVAKARVVVGGFSTGIIETAWHSIPYIVYEPDGNGYTKESIKNSPIIDRNRVARTKNQLIALLRSGKSSVAVSNDKLFLGDCVSTIRW